MEIRGCSGYVVVSEKGNFFNLLKSIQYGSGNQRKPLIEKRKQWLQCWNIITFFLQSHYNQKRWKDPHWDTFYINHHSKKLEKMFGDPWRHLQPILIELGILDKNESYQVDGHTQSYRLNKKLIHSKHFILEDLTEENLDRDYKSRVTLDTEYILTNFETIAKKRAENQAKKKGRKSSKGWSPFDKIMLIKQVKEFNYHDNNVIASTGREFNKANNIPSEFREHLYIDAEPTTEIDIKSSLPCVLYKYTKGEERQRYGDLIKQGQLYEFFANELGIPTLRDKTKKAFVVYLGGYRKYLCKDIGLILHKHFPNLHEWIEDVEAKHIKANPKGKGGEVSRVLQKIESKVIVNMMKEMHHADIFTVSIHDGVRVKTYQELLVTEAIEKAFQLLVGIKPILTVEEYTPQDDRDEIDQLFEEALVNTMMLEWNIKDFED